MATTAFKIPYGTISAICDSLKDIIPKAAIKVDKDGLSFCLNDTTITSAVALHIDADRLPAFSCPAPISLGLHLGNLGVLLKAIACTPEDLIRITHSEPDRFVRVISERLNTKREKYDEFRLTLADCPLESAEVEIGDSLITAAIPANEFSTMAKEISILSSDFKLSGQNSTVNFEFQADIVQGSINYTTNTESSSRVVKVSVNEPTS